MYVAGTFQQVLDGVNTGFLRSVEGGAATAEVISEVVGTSYFAKKHLGQIRYDPFGLRFGLAMSTDVYDWINASWSGNYQRKDGAIVAADHQLTAVSQREFFHKGQESGQASQGKSRKSQGKRPEPEVAIASRKGFNASAAGCEVASRTKFTACVLSRVFDSDAGGPSNRPSLAVVSNACSSPAAHRESNLAAQPHLRGRLCERQSACLTGVGPRCAIERGAVSYNGASENHASPAYRPHPIG